MITARAINMVKIRLRRARRRNLEGRRQRQQPRRGIGLSVKKEGDHIRERRGVSKRENMIFG